MVSLEESENFCITNPSLLFQRVGMCSVVLSTLLLQIGSCVCPYRHIYSWDSAFQFPTECYLFIRIKQGQVTIFPFSTTVNLLIGINSCFLSIVIAEPAAALSQQKGRERDKVKEGEWFMFVPSSLLLPFVSPPLTLTERTVHVLYIKLSSKSNEITSLLC